MGVNPTVHCSILSVPCVLLPGNFDEQVSLVANLKHGVHGVRPLSRDILLMIVNPKDVKREIQQIEFCLLSEQMQK